MDFNIMTIPVTILFIINGAMNFHHSIQLKKKFKKEHNFTNSVCFFILWISAGILYPILYPSGNKYILLQTISNIIIVFLTPIGIILTFMVQAAITKKKPWLMKYRRVEYFIKKFEGNEKRLRKLGKDMHRKALHFIPPIMILLLLAMSNSYSKELGISLILTFGYAGIIFISAIDFVRSTYIYGQKRIDYLVPPKITELLAKTMKRREIYEPFKVVPLILGLLPSLFLPISIFLSVMLIATIGDGAASFFGNLLGRINWPKGSKKTIIGYAAGAVTSFILVMGVCCFLEPTWTYQQGITLSLVGMTTFLLVDLSNSRIDDNLLNPLFSTLTMGITYLTIF